MRADDDNLASVLAVLEPEPRPSQRFQLALFFLRVGIEPARTDFTLTLSHFLNRSAACLSASARAPSIKSSSHSDPLSARLTLHPSSAASS